MTVWTKIERKRGGPRRMEPCTYRTRSGRRTAHLFLPVEMVTADRVDLYSDGAGRLAFHMHDNGARAVFQAAKEKKRRRITIPKPHSEALPFGTHVCELTRDGDMLVLDLKQFEGVGK